MAEYIRCFSMAETIHSICEDYRAAATIGLQHDEADMDQRIQCPLQVLWGGARLMEKTYDVLEIWRKHAVDVSGGALDCGHFLTEEKPHETYDALVGFFRQ